MGARLRLVLPHAVMLAAALLLYWAAERIDADTGGRISPAAWPKAVLALMALLCLYEIAKRLVVGAATTAKGLVGDLENARDSGPEHPRRLYGAIGLVIAYVFAVQWLGFFVSTALFLAVFPLVGGLRRPVLTAAIGIVGSLLLVVVFMRVAYISLPLGVGPFRELSIALLRWIGVS